MKAKNRFWRMLAMVAADRWRVRTLPIRSPFRRATPALSMATSVPLPMAIATSAAVERRRVVDAVLGHGHHATWRASAPRPCPCPRAAPRPRLRRCRASEPRPWRGGASPVSMTTRTPACCRDETAAGVVGLIGSAIATMPAALPSTATKMAVAPSLVRRCSLLGVVRYVASSPRACHARRGNA